MKIHTECNNDYVGFFKSKMFFSNLWKIFFDFSIGQGSLSLENAKF